MSSEALAGTGYVADMGAFSEIHLRVHIDVPSDPTGFRPSHTDIAEWEAVFDVASKVLWEATEAQVRIGVVEFSYGDFGAHGADIWANYSGATQVFGLIGFNTSYINLNLFGQSLRGYNNTHPYRDFGFMIAHELAHYVFDLNDEYEKPCAPNSSTNQGGGLCIEDAATTSRDNCVMQFRWGLHRDRIPHEFCTDANHDSNRGTQCLLRQNPVSGVTMNLIDMTQQEQGHGRSCWRTMVDLGGTYQGPSYRSFLFPMLNYPLQGRVNPSTGLSGYLPPQIIDRTGDEATVVLALDRSCSMGWSTEADNQEVCGDAIDSDGDGDSSPNEPGCTFSRMHHLRAGATAFLENRVPAGISVQTLWWNNTQGPVSPLRNLNGTTLSNAVADVSAGASPLGGTAMGDALTRAGAELASVAGYRFVYLFTDGDHNVGSDPIMAGDQLFGDGIVIWPAFVGRAGNLDLLYQVGRRFGGQIFQDRAPEHVGASFSWFWAIVRGKPLAIPFQKFRSQRRVSNQEVLPECVRPVGSWLQELSNPQPCSQTPAEVVRTLFKVSPDSRAVGVDIFGTNKNAGTFAIDVRLVSPSGQIYSQSSTQAGFRYLVGTSYRALEVIEPAPGPWLLEVEAANYNLQEGYFVVSGDALGERFSFELDPPAVQVAAGSSVQAHINVTAGSVLKDLAPLDLVVIDPSGAASSIPVTLGVDNLHHATISGLTYRGYHRVAVRYATNSGTTQIPGEPIFPSSAGSVQIDGRAGGGMGGFFVGSGVPGPQGGCCGDGPQRIED